MGRSAGTDNTTIIRGSVVSSVPRDTERSHYLAVLVGDKPGQRVRLANQPVVIGRAEPSDWILADGEVSRTHCRVYLALDEVIVVDLESSNGTFIEGQRIDKGTPLPVGARIQIGSHVIEHEWLTRQEVEDLQALHQDAEKAGQYIRSLLPKPLRTEHLRSDWVLIPSARLGGDVFGHRALNDRRTAMYMIDVAGSGAGAAMHAVSVLDILGRGSLPITNFDNPANVLETLNVMFEAKFHGGLSASVWYGVYDTETKRLRYGSAGHHPAFLVTPKRDRAIPLQTEAPEIGVKKGVRFSTSKIDVHPKSVLYVFSDGVFEYTNKDGDVATMDDFVKLILQPPMAGKTEPLRLLGEVRDRALKEDVEDDFALMTLTFL